LLGRQFFRTNNIDGFRRAAQAFAKAVALDPAYAPAWAALGQATYWVADTADSAAAVSEGQERAMAAAEKAIALEPDLSDGYLVRSFLRIAVKWDWMGAQADIERALAIDPESAEVLSAYGGGLLRALGRSQEAAATLRKAVELDPLNARTWGMLGIALSIGGQYGGAREAFNRSLEVSPEQSFTPFNLGINLLVDGQPEAARAASQRSTTEIFRLAGAALADHTLGHAKESQEALDALTRKSGHIAAYQIAEVHAWRGETDKAFEWLERARVQRDGGLASVKTDPLLRKLRGDPRYLALLGKMNLPLD
jgi:tetratricopeptide (TPR) repeat protein